VSSAGGTSGGVLKKLINDPFDAGSIFAAPSPDTCLAAIRVASTTSARARAGGG
jgi:hypothetical protein